MKKLYIQPATETVRLNINDSILEEIGIVNNSYEVSDDGLAKEQGDFFDMDDDLNDIWGDSGDTNPYDLWNE